MSANPIKSMLARPSQGAGGRSAVNSRLSKSCPLDTPKPLPKNQQSVFTRFLVVACAIAALLLQAGAGETIENLLHLMAHGHTAHDSAHAIPDQGPSSDHGDAHSDLEHSCAGHFHVCHCCAHPVMANGVVHLAIPPAPARSENLTLSGSRAGPEGTGTFVFRPPIAA